MTFDEYVLQQNSWIKEERMFLVGIKNKNKLINSIEDFIYNIDEITIVLQSNKPRKQLCSINNEIRCVFE